MVEVVVNAIRVAVFSGQVDAVTDLGGAPYLRSVGRLPHPVRRSEERGDRGRSRPQRSASEAAAAPIGAPPARDAGDR